MKANFNKKQIKLEDKKLSRAVEDFCELKAHADDIKSQMEPLKIFIIDKAKEILEKEDVATVTFEYQNNKIKVTFGWDVKIKDDKALKEILGDTFDVLVKHEEIFKPERKLKEMALEDDGLKNCLDVKEKTPLVSVVK